MNSAAEFTDVIDSEIVDLIVERASRDPLDRHLPPALWSRLAHLRLNFRGTAHVVSVRKDRALVLIVPEPSTVPDPGGDWARVSRPTFLVLNDERQASAPRETPRDAA